MYSKLFFQNLNKIQTSENEELMPVPTEFCFLVPWSLRKKPVAIFCKQPSVCNRRRQLVDVIYVILLMRSVLLNQWEVALKSAGAE